MAKKYYAVRNGRTTGLFYDWNDCQDQVHGYSGAEYRGFNSQQAAEDYLYDDYDDSYDSSYSSEYDSDSYSESVPEVHVYTDGSCLGNGQGYARAGWGVFWGNNRRENCCGSVDEGEQTNNRGELMAIRKVLRQINGHMGRDDVTFVINTDSYYSIKSTHEWADRWEKNGWRRAKGAVKNVDLIQDVREELRKAAYRGYDIEFRHVRAHENNYGNEMADELAREGADY